MKIVDRLFSDVRDLFRPSSATKTTRFENQKFDYLEDRSSGRVFSDIEFINCNFVGAGFSSIRIDNEEGLDLVSLRSIARNLIFINCRVAGVGFVGPGIVEDCLIDGLKVSNHVQTTGTVFRHVVVKGKVDKFMLTPNVDLFKEFPEVQRQFDEANQRYYEDVDWALDIREAKFKDCDIRSVPARLIRRDPETQGVITREKAMEGEWRNLDLSRTYWPGLIDLFLESGDKDCVLVAPKASRDFRPLLEGIDRLRKLGVVE